MNTLKSLTFTTLPTQGANPILDRRAKVIARLEEQKLILKTQTTLGQSGVGEEGWRKGDGRKAATSAVVVATASERFVCVVCSEWAEANRVRERQTRNCRSFPR